MKLLIIADDFTGALDTGVQLSKNNISTYVLADSQHIPQPMPECQVAVINADIRHATPTAAYNYIQSILKKLYFNGLYLYIKTDSVFRGNISAAFCGAIDYVKKPLFFVPAYPKLNRTTKEATAYVDGELLENSVFANDPRTPSAISYIPSIINRDYKLPVKCIEFSRQADLTESDIEDGSIYLFDCENDEQLNKIGNTVKKFNGYKFCAGCAGFAQTFATNISFAKENTLSKNDVNNKPSLFVSGSANEITFKQLLYAKKCNYPVFSLNEKLDSYIYNSTENFDYKDFNNNLPFQNMVGEVSTILQNNKSVIIATATQKSELLDFDRLHKIGKKDEQIHNCIAQYTSNLVKSILDTSDLTNIVVFGGDMAASILQKLDIHEVKAGGEIIAGVPICYAVKNNKTINLVTKSGGFGSEDLIPVIENYFMKG